MVEKVAVTNQVTVSLASCYLTFEPGDEMWCKKVPHLLKRGSHLSGLAEGWWSVIIG